MMIVYFLENEGINQTPDQPDRVLVAATRASEAQQIAQTRWGSGYVINGSIPAIEGAAELI